MAHRPSATEVEKALDGVFGTTPLIFIQEFLRGRKRKNKSITIGSTVKDARAALRGALLSEAISVAGLEQWLEEVEGWGRQHLYLTRVPKRSLTGGHLLTETNLTGFLKRKNLWGEVAVGAEAPVHALNDVAVDDELARLTWRVHGSDWERREEFDELRELADGEYQFRAYRRLLRRSASRVLIRKTDGVVLFLIDVPLGDDHDKLRKQVDGVINTVVAPLAQEVIALGPIVRALDTGAVNGFGPKPRRKLALGIDPTQARYRAEGAQVEFKSTRESTGYTDSEAVRRVRKAMQIERFVGVAGKFRLTFEGKDRRQHAMVVSFSAPENRAYLFSRMDEQEVLALVDHLLAVSPK